MDKLHEDPDRRVEHARASLRAHAEELGRRFGDAKHMLDIPAKITAHPRLAVGIAFAVGALLGFPGKRAKTSIPDASVKTGLMGAAMATLGSLAFQLAKSVAFHQLSEQAKVWWDKQQHELGASHTRETESFLQH